MATPYDPSLLTILDTLARPGIDGFRAEVYRYADGSPKVRFCRSNAKGEWRKVDNYTAADLVNMAELCGPARVALSLHDAPPVQTVDPRIAALEAELAALRASVPVSDPVVAPLAPVKAPVSVSAPAPRPAKVSAPVAVRPSVSSALSALGVS